MRTAFFFNKYVIASMVIILAVLFVLVFIKKDKVYFITDIYERSLNDTIINVYSEKYRGTVVVATALNKNDTPLLTDGVNDLLHIHFSSYSDEGLKAWENSNTSILWKKAKSDSFYLYRSNQVIGFRMIDKSYLIP